MSLPFGAARAQTPLPVLVSAATPDTARVAEVRFRGPRVLPLETLQAAVRTRPNRRFLGVPGATWWLWLYRTGRNPRLGRFGRALAAAGEPPAVTTLATVAADADRLALLLQQEGYRRATVAARVDTLRRARVRVTFEMAPGPPALVTRAVVDVGTGTADPLGADEVEALIGGSLLRPRGPVAPPESLGVGFGLGFTPGVARYSETLLQEERRRVLGFLRDRGFAAAARDSIRVLVYPDSAGDRLRLVLRLRPGPRFLAGPVRAVVEGPEDGAPTRVERRGPPLFDVAVEVRGERRLDPALVFHSLRVRPGAPYRQSALAETKRRLDATGAFAFTDVAPLWADTFRVDATGRPAETGALVLPHRLGLRTRPRHGVRAETFALQRSGVLSVGDSELGMGAAVTYENANLFGRAERFRLRAAATVAADTDTRLFTSRQTELSASVTTPYIPRPLGPWAERVAPEGVRAAYSLSALAARRDELRLRIRARIAARVRLELQHTRPLASIVDLADLSLSNPDTLAGFRGRFLDELFARVTDPVEQARLVEDYTRPVVNTTVRYTLRYNTAPPITRSTGALVEASAAAGGYLEALLDRLVFSPGTVEETLPGFGGSRLVYRPFVRLTLDARRYVGAGPSTVVAFKGIAGAAFATGRAGVVPFDQRFYAGGATSVRGWGLRQLGPGAASFGGADVLGGDVRLEASAEVRQTVVRTFLGADWIGAAFLDAGNVWFGPRNPGFTDVRERRDGRFRAPDFVAELGVGTGLGLRLSWPYLVVRLDVAAKALDPAEGGDLFPEGVRRPTLHFGLGHAF